MSAEYKSPSICISNSQKNACTMVCKKSCVQKKTILQQEGPPSVLIIWPKNHPDLAHLKNMCVWQPFSKNQCGQTHFNPHHSFFLMLTQQQAFCMYKNSDILHWGQKIVLPFPRIFTFFLSLPIWQDRKKTSSKCGKIDACSDTWNSNHVSTKISFWMHGHLFSLFLSIFRSPYRLCILPSSKHNLA